MQTIITAVEIARTALEKVREKLPGYPVRYMADNLITFDDSVFYSASYAYPKGEIQLAFVITVVDEKIFVDIVDMTTNFSCPVIIGSYVVSIGDTQRTNGRTLNHSVLQAAIAQLSS